MTTSKAAFRTGAEIGAIKYESRLKRANGEILDVEISTSRVDMKKGIMQSIVSNITARKNMQKALEQSEEKFRTFMETAGDFMFMSDDKGKLLYVNTSMANSLGYAREDMENLYMTDILSQVSLDVHKKAEETIREKGEVLYEPVWETKNRKKYQKELKREKTWLDGAEVRKAHNWLAHLSL